MDDQVTYACTLTPDQAAGREDDDRALGTRVRQTRRSDRGVVVTFDGGEETQRLVERFVANESRCCGFFDFAVEEGDDVVSLEITAPPAAEAQALVDAAQRTFAEAAERSDG